MRAPSKRRTELQTEDVWAAYPDVERDVLLADLVDDDD